MAMVLVKELRTDWQRETLLLRFAEESGASIAFFVEQAKAALVRVSSHLSYADRASFGRVVMEVSTDQLKRDLDLQRRLLPDTSLLKFHGALYNQVCSDEALATALVPWIAQSGFEEIITL